MEVYLKRVLLKELNEIYYRHYQDTEMVALTLDSTDEELVKNGQLARQFGNYNYQMMVEDLNDVFNDCVVSYRSRTATNYLFKLDASASLVRSAFPESYIFREVCETLAVLSENASIVGGFNRDAILGIESKDIDFATDTSYEVLKEAFKALGYGIKEEGEAFLVLMVSKKNSEGKNEFYEIANFRKDSKDGDGRRPDSVEVGNIKDDGSRRDFTVNALFYNLLSGEIIDPTGRGIEDIDNLTLRFIGKPEDRIREDYLRTWRAFRLAKTKGLTMERKTERALRSMFKEAYENSNPARVLQEMISMLK